MKKKLLFLIHALNPAGAQRVLLELVNNLDFDRFDVTVQTIYDHGELIEQLDSRIRYRSIIRSKNARCKRLRSAWLRRVATPEYLYRHYVEDDYDYAVAYLEGECTRIISGCRNPKTKTIAWVHADFEKLFVADKVFKNTAEHKLAYQTFDKIVCVSHGAKRGFVYRFGDEWGDKLVVKYNLIDGERIVIASQQEAVLPMPKDVFSIVSVGNLRPEKGYDRLLPICRRLVDEGYRFHLTIIGGGSEYDNIVKQREELRLQDTVTLFGNQANPYCYMKQADLFLLGSYSESFGVVLAEAMMLDVPAVAAESAGVCEVLDDGTYGIIAPNTAEDIYENLKRVLEDPSILDEYRERLPQRKAFFDKENALNAIVELFE